MNVLNNLAGIVSAKFDNDVSINLNPLLPVSLAYSFNASEKGNDSDNIVKSIFLALKKTSADCYINIINNIKVIDASDLFFIILFNLL